MLSSAHTRALDRLAWLTLMVFIAAALLTTIGWLGADFATISENEPHLPPSATHWLGTDIFGRDVLSRVLHGSKTALAVGGLSSALALAIGTTLGVFAGLSGGLVDRGVRWLYTTIDAVPYILLLSAFALILGQGLQNLYLALGLTGWATICRIVRSETQKICRSHYFLASRSLGTPWFQLIGSSVLPNLKHILLTRFGLFFVFAIKFEVVLSFIGLGLEPGTPSLGAMISDARSELLQGIWWNFTGASLCLFFLVFSVHWLLLRYNERGFFTPQEAFDV